MSLLDLALALAHAQQVPQHVELTQRSTQGEGEVSAGAARASSAVSWWCLALVLSSDLLLFSLLFFLPFFSVLAQSSCCAVRDEGEEATG